MSDPSTPVFLSYSHNDRAAAASLVRALEQAGLAVFKDDASLRSGDRWLSKLQQAINGCGAFVVLVGRDGVQRWVGAEVEVALCRHLSPHDDQDRLPIFPVLLGDAAPESLPPFLALFQITRWDGVAALPDDLVDALRARQSRFDAGPAVEGCPFLGLSAFTRNDARLFFGRRLETLEALAGLGDQTESNPECLAGCGGSAYKRWLQIEGNSGAGKSSLVQAGMVPMIERGALWSRTGIESWRILGPMMPGRQPVEKLAEVLERGLVAEPSRRDTLGRLQRLEKDERALAFALREQGAEKTAFLLIVDQFEELFTFADEGPRKVFDTLLAHALQDPECPLFVISTVRADFLDRYDQLTRLGGIYNRLCKRYFLPSISEPGLRDVIAGPAKLAGLDVSEVLTAILEDARDELAGALPLVENALRGLWEMRRGQRLSGEDYRGQGGLVGMLASQADALLAAIEAEKGMAGRGRAGALDLLLRLTRINDGGRHTRQRISRQEALIAAGNGKEDIGERILRRLSGERAEEALAGAPGSLRLIVVTTERDAQGQSLRDVDGGLVGHVDLIHETLIRARGKDEHTGKLIGYWPTLNAYLETNRDRDLHRQQLAIETRRWSQSRRFGRWWNLAVLGDYLRYRRLHVAPKSLERHFLKWSLVALIGQAALGSIVIGTIGESAWWANEFKLPPSYILRKPLWWLGIAPMPEMVEIKPGRFTMGCKPERDVVDYITCNSNDARPVTVDKPYSLGKYEVTFLQYDYYVWDQKRKGRGQELNYPRDVGWGREERPVLNVSWNDAVAYLDWLNERAKLDVKRELYRLPTEAEWEYAARGGLDTPFGWAGREFNKARANCGPHTFQTLPVTRIEGWANGFGLHDMLGNVSEWTEDIYQSMTDERGTFETRVVRGGAWLDGVCGVARRDQRRPDHLSDFIGFRVCRGAPIEPLDTGALNTEAPPRIRVR